MEGVQVNEVPVRDAATIILVRDPATGPKILMGQRGANAVFLPNKFVFPGGAVDRDDATVPFARPMNDICSARLASTVKTGDPRRLAGAAIRELWEEAGQVLGAPGQWDGDIPQDWQTYADTGHVPSAEALHFVFRAITPPTRPRRFDARFFLADADHLASDPDDFSAATDELSHLQWIPLDQARGFDLTFITEVVLAEIAATLPNITAPQSVPFFDNTKEQSLFERLGGRSPLDAISSAPAPKY